MDGVTDRKIDGREVESLAVFADSLCAGASRFDDGCLEDVLEAPFVDPAIDRGVGQDLNGFSPPGDLPGLDCEDLIADTENLSRIMGYQKNREIEILADTHEERQDFSL